MRKLSLLIAAVLLSGAASRAWAAAPLTTRALLCAAVLDPMVETTIEISDTIRMMGSMGNKNPVMVATPRFIIGGDGTVYSRADFRTLGVIGDNAVANDGKGNAYLPLGFNADVLRGDTRLAGLGTEVKFARMRYAFEVDGYRGVIADIDPKNLRSLALHHKLGFWRAPGETRLHYTTRPEFRSLQREKSHLTLEEFAAPRRRLVFSPNAELAWPTDPGEAYRSSVEMADFYESLLPNNFGADPSPARSLALQAMDRTEALRAMKNGQSPGALIAALEAEAAREVSPASAQEPYERILRAFIDIVRANTSSTARLVR